MVRASAKLYTFKNSSIYKQESYRKSKEMRMLRFLKYLLNNPKEIKNKVVFKTDMFLYWNLFELKAREQKRDEKHAKNRCIICKVQMCTTRSLRPKQKC